LQDIGQGGNKISNEKRITTSQEKQGGIIPQEETDVETTITKATVVGVTNILRGDVQRIRYAGLGVSKDK
jgi:hypothetical protein